MDAIDLEEARQDIPGATHTELMALAYELVARAEAAELALKEQERNRIVEREIISKAVGAMNLCRAWLASSVYPDPLGQVPQHHYNRLTIAAGALDRLLALTPEPVKEGCPFVHDDGDKCLQKAGHDAHYPKGKPAKEDGNDG